MTEPEYSTELKEWYIQDGESIYFFKEEAEARQFYGEPDPNGEEKDTK